MKKQYSYQEKRHGSFQYAVYLYHNGKLIETKEIYFDELSDIIEALEDQGYSYGFTEAEVEFARLRYERMLANIIEEEER